MKKYVLLSLSLILILAATLPSMAQINGRRLYAHPPIKITAVNDAGPNGYSPAQVRAAYSINAIPNQGQGQVVAIVDAYDNPNVEADLQQFDSNYHLATCTTQNGCFKKVYATGTQPPGNTNWGLEMALDVEWSHAIAPAAQILLVEAADNSFDSLLLAVDVAVANGASVVSMSWGGGEDPTEVDYDFHFQVPGVTFCASSGDSGHGAQYPAASPYVVGVGGTTLVLLYAVPPPSPFTSNYGNESAWHSSGGGTSSYELEPTYQQVVQQTGFRGIPDVGYLATNTPIYDTYGFSGWVTVQGTSIGSPQWAAILGLANSSRVAAGKGTLTQTLTDLYNYPNSPNYANYHDVTMGNNGNCGAQCQAAAGYDYITGIGTPIGNKLVATLVADTN